MSAEFDRAYEAMQKRRQPRLTVRVLKWIGKSATGLVVFSVTFVCVFVILKLLFG